MIDRLTAALGRVARPCRPVPRERLSAAVLEEQRWLAESRNAGGLAAGSGMGQPSMGPAGRLAARAEWLARGTSEEQVRRLDAVRDADQIVHHLLSTYRVESWVAETLAINRVACWQALSLFLRSTGEAEGNSRARFFDTYALFANYFEWGEDSRRGLSAVRRMNEIHGRYYLPSEGMKYVLLNTAFTWLDAIDAVARRPLAEVERSGFFHAHLRLGRALGIEGLGPDVAEMRRWFHARNAEHAFATPFKRDTFETFVGNSLGSAREDWPVLRLALRAGMDEDYRAALGYEPLLDAELAAVRVALGRVVEQRGRCVGAPVRSLEAAGGRPSRAAGQLGVSGRSARLPQPRPQLPNAGYPEGQCPIASRGDAPPMALPEYDWSEIRERVREGAQWLVIDGEIHDVSAFSDRHPGGAAALREHLGRDATEAFRGAGHSRMTDVLRLNYRVGVLRRGS